MLVFDSPTATPINYRQDYINSLINTPEDLGNGVWKVKLDMKTGVRPNFLNLWLWYIRAAYESAGGESEVAISYICDYGFGEYDLRSRDSDGEFKLIVDKINEPLVGSYRMVIPVPVPDMTKSISILFSFLNSTESKRGSIYMYADVSNL